MEADEKEETLLRSVALQNARSIRRARERAEEDRATLAAIVEWSDDCIISKDLNGIITSWNHGAERIFGYTAQEAIGQPVTMLIPPDRLDEEPGILERIRLKEAIEHYETVRRRKDGTLVDISLTVSPIINACGQVVGASKIARDITERKRAGQNLAFLAEVSEFFAPLVTAEAILRVAGDKFHAYFGVNRVTFLDVNPVANEVTAIHEKLDDGLRDAGGPHRLSKFLSADFIRELKAGKTIAVNDVRSDPRTITQLAAYEPWGTVSLALAPYLSEGRWTFMLALQKDAPYAWRADEIALLQELSARVHLRLERARAEEALQQSEQRVAADLQAMMWLHEIGNHCARGGNDFEKCLDEIVEAAIAITRADKGNMQLLHPESGALKIAASRGFDQPLLSFFDSVRRGEGLASGAAMQSAERVIVEDVTESEIFAGHPSLNVLLEYGVRAVQSTPLMSSAGYVLGVISTHFRQPHRPNARELRLMDLLARQAADYLDLKRAEEERAQLLQREQAARAEAEAANRAKDEFLATVSHELRNPLNAILGWATLLRTRRTDEATSIRAVETIERSARIQAQLIEEILDVARITAGKLRLEVRPVDLEQVISTAVDTLRPAADAKRIQIQTQFDKQVGMVSSDPNRLQQVLWNLLSNAIKFTPDGGRVDVRLHVAAGPSRSHAQIIVSDTGKGISADFLPYVFDRFRQADSTSTRKHGGLGLGLAIVRQIVELHGGTVHVESRGEGEGTTFTVRLPLETSQHEGVATPRERRVLPQTFERTQFDCPPEISGLRLLIVDDEPNVLEMLSAAFGQCGAEVKTSISAAAALEVLHEWKPDVLLSDIAMPGEDGFTLIAKVRALEQALGERIQAIALTGYVRVEDRTRVLAAGYDRFVPKPVEPAELLSTLAGLVSGKRKGMSADS